MPPRITCIVEGHGEVEALPILIRRFTEKVDPTLPIHVGKPLRVPKSKLLRGDEFERTIELAGRFAGAEGGIFVLIDSDDDCPKEWGPRLLERAHRKRSNQPISVVLAKQEFEAWFLASAESLRGKRGLADDLAAPGDPEAIRGAKEWLSAQKRDGSRYSETVDQPALAKIFDLEAAKKAASFEKFHREILKLIETLLSRSS